MKDKKYVYNTFNLWRRDESDRFTKHLAWYCAQRSGRFSQELCNYLASDHLEALCTYSIDYYCDDNYRELAYARQCLALYSKNADLKIPGVDPEFAFLQSLAETELKCWLTNRRFSSLYQSNQLLDRENGLVLAVSRKITDILGECPSLSELDFRFGPGLNVGLPNAKKTSARHKLDAPISCSLDFNEELMEKLLVELPHMFENDSSYRSNTHYVAGKLSSVPKSALTKRSIIIEPILNGLIQLGIGGFLKKRLLECGIDLTDQSRNQRLAQIGSLNGSYCTIDLSNASNSIALLVVFHLIQSEEWFNLLDYSRTSKVNYNSVEIVLEMFSSMGNGFTFELESLLFYAITYVTVTRNGGDTSKISVYGDDIIVDNRNHEMVSELYRNLSFFGFSVNDKKSFRSGPFRESCGSDFFLGKNIRPFYCKDRWTDARLIGLLNHDRRNLDLFADIRLEYEMYLTNKGVTFGPDGYGDGHLSFPDWDHQGRMHLGKTKQSPDKRKASRPSFYFKTIVKMPLRDTNALEKGDVLYPLYSIYRKQSSKHKYVVIYSCEDGIKPVIKTVVPTVTSLEDDPYVLRDGWKTKVVKVPLFGI